MGSVTNLADYRAAKERQRKPSAPAMPGRTAELAFVLAIIDALPAATRRKALASVLRMGERCPGSEETQLAANLAACLQLGGKS